MTADTAARDVRITTFPARRVAFIRHVGPYMEVGPTFGRLTAWAGRRGLFRPDTLVLGVCWDDPAVTLPDKLRMDCCVTAPDGVAADGEVGVQTVGGGEYALLSHTGPYAGLGHAYRWLYGLWLPASGREPRNAPPFEVYVNSPRDTPPEKLRTDIHLPLDPR
jgi:AraC family transcriptional regulator